jgi:hypothetical protein
VPGLAVVDTRAVQDQHRLTVAVLHVVDPDVIDPALHFGSVATGTDNAAGTRMVPETAGPLWCCRHR